MSKQRLDECMSGHEMLDYSRKHPRTKKIIPGHGRHMKVYTDLGQTVIPDDRKDMNPGLRHTILKQLRRIGITVLILLPLAGFAAWHLLKG